VREREALEKGKASFTGGGSNGCIQGVNSGALTGRGGKFERNANPLQERWGVGSAGCISHLNEVLSTPLAAGILSCVFPHYTLKKGRGQTGHTLFPTLQRREQRKSEVRLTLLQTGPFRLP